MAAGRGRLSVNLKKKKMFKFTKIQDGRRPRPAVGLFKKKKKKKNTRNLTVGPLW
jgi:hypothetical protein